MSCFTCLRIAKSFGSDLQTYELRLAILHLRLSRWGKTIGLTSEDADDPIPEAVPFDPETGAIVVDLLKKIGILFDAVEKTTQDLGEPAAGDSEEGEPV